MLCESKQLQWKAVVGSLAKPVLKPRMIQTHHCTTCTDMDSRIFMTVGTGDYNSPINERLTISNLSCVPTGQDCRGRAVAECANHPVLGWSNLSGIRCPVWVDVNNRILALVTRRDSEKCNHALDPLVAIATVWEFFHKLCPTSKEGTCVHLT